MNYKKLVVQEFRSKYSPLSPHRRDISRLYIPTLPTFLTPLTLLRQFSIDKLLGVK
jgi:hypothetical protein